MPTEFLSSKGGGDCSLTVFVFSLRCDHLGTPQAITDENGSVVWKADYKPFGEVTLTTSAVENNFRFPGQFYDAETGLHYNWHRYYDAGTGRYLRSDPIGLEGGMNLYVYVNGNPISNIDPSGLWHYVEHRRLTQAAMRVGELFNQIDAERVMRANTDVDRLANQFNNPAHYMPGTREQAERLINNLLERAVEYELSGEHERAMNALGRGLHTLQDRYAHYEQNAGWYNHLPFLGTSPDDPEKHPDEFYQAYVASTGYIDIFLEEVARRRCE